MVRRSENIRKEYPENYDAMEAKLKKEFARQDQIIQSKTKEQMETLRKNISNDKLKSGEYQPLEDKEMKMNPSQRTEEEIKEIMRRANLI